MKGMFMALPSIFILGAIVGGWGARERLAREQSNFEKSRASERESGRRMGFDAFTQALNLPEKAKRPGRRGAPPKAATNVATKVAAPAPTNVAARAAATNANPFVFGGGRRRMRPENLAARIEEAKELWSARVEIARANAVKRLKLTPDGEKAFDEALARMNQKIGESVAAVAERLSGEEKFSHELGVRLMGDLGISLAETYDELGAAVGEGSRADVSQLNLIDFVDPSVAEPLVGLQDKLVPPGQEAR
jgi:hypothetical protein